MSLENNQSLLSLSERHKHILDSINKEGKVTVVDLCNHLNVSSVTIRKDLTLLETKNLLHRTHGGATLSNPYATDRHVSEKENIKATEKTSIGQVAAALGQVAAALIEPEDSIIIASGTTVQFLARAIQPKGKLTVLTSALNVAMELNLHPDIEVIVLGGTLRKSSSSGTGPYAEKMLEDFSCSKLYLGVDGIDAEFGITTTHIMEAQLNRKMIAAAQKTILLTDSSKFGKRGFGKFGKRGFGRICGLEEVDQIITDSGISDHYLQQLKEMGIEVTIV